MESPLCHCPVSKPPSASYKLEHKQGREDIKVKTNTYPFGVEDVGMGHWAENTRNNHLHIYSSCSSFRSLGLQTSLIYVSISQPRSQALAQLPSLAVSHSLPLSPFHSSLLLLFPSLTFTITGEESSWTISLAQCTKPFAWGLWGWLFRVIFSPVPHPYIFTLNG